MVPNKPSNGEITAINLTTQIYWSISALSIKICSANLSSKVSVSVLFWSATENILDKGLSPADSPAACFLTLPLIVNKA